MRPQLRVLVSLLAVAAALTVPACSKNKSKSSNVKITVLPEKPVVFTYDFKYTSVSGNEVSVKGPWFKIVTIYIQNQSDTTVTITALHVEVTGVDEIGSISTNSFDFDPSSMNVQTDLKTCTYTDLGEFAPAATLGTQLTATKTASSSATCPTGALSFTIGGNPKPASTVGSIRYTVKVKPIGYFGVRELPTDRFENYTMFYTQ